MPENPQRVGAMPSRQLSLRRSEQPTLRQRVWELGNRSGSSTSLRSLLYGKRQRKETSGRHAITGHELSKSDTNDWQYRGGAGTITSHGERHARGGRDRRFQGPGQGYLHFSHLNGMGRASCENHPTCGDGASLPPSLPRRPSIQALLRTHSTNCLKVYSPTCGYLTTTAPGEFFGHLLASLQSASMEVCGE